MYVQRIIKKVKNRTYSTVLLVESYRDGGKVKHRTVLNLSKWEKQQVDALDASLKGNYLSSLDDLETKAGKSIGGIWVFKQLADQLGITKVLGKGKEALFALLLIIGRIITQGSRLHLCQWGRGQELEDVLGIKKYDENHLYATLDWLSINQEDIEDALFKSRYNDKPPRLFLYDVTSSYLEGQQNELAAYGYNRDGKKAKKQIVIGLLTDDNGIPVAVRVFKGNTSDTSTVCEQVKKLSNRFGVKNITLVGDRGMIKNVQIEHLSLYGFDYITAITKVQIKTLLKDGVFQIDLFDDKLMEIEYEGVRYVLRKNPHRVEELKNSKMSKYEKIKAKSEELSKYLKEHPKAKVETVLKTLNELTATLSIKDWVDIKENERNIVVSIDDEKLKENSILDGCYAIKTNLTKEDITADKIHERYKDLSLVEHAFKIMKTEQLEVRPVYVRKKSRTVGHVFVTMLAYILTHEFDKRTSNLSMTTEYMVDVLDKIQTIEISLAGKTVKRIPTPGEDAQTTLNALDIKLPLNV
ncbi:MAG: IS1634 family transposase [Nitrospirae bacterium]|nr:IS1634 family transposase [Nitrospirota bacterium]